MLGNVNIVSVLTGLLDYGGLGVAMYALWLLNRWHKETNNRQDKIDDMVDRMFDRMIQVSSETADALKAIEIHLALMNGRGGDNEHSNDS